MRKGGSSETVPRPFSFNRAYVVSRFRKAAKGDFLDKLIDFCTGSVGYSHVELVFSDGVFFSASPRGGGVRYKNEVYNDDWVIVTLDITGEEEEIIRAFCDSQNGKEYDFWGAVCTLSQSFGEDKRRWFCTEVIIRALQQVFIQSNLIPSHQTPNSYYIHCTEANAFRRHL